MAHALLWACLDPVFKSRIPNQLQHRVETAWKQYYRANLAEEGLPEDAEVPNPIMKVPLHIWNLNGTLRINEQYALVPGAAGGVPAPVDENAAPPDEGGNVGAGGVGVGGEVGAPNGISRQDYQQLLAHIHELKTMLATLHQQIDAHFYAQRNHFDTHLNRQNNNIRQFGGNIRGAFTRGVNQQHAQQQQQQAQAEANPNVVDEAPGQATLMARPRSLYELWLEYTQGHNGAKPAREFTARERNNRRSGIKQKYYRRKYVWDLVSTMVREGYTAHAACNRIMMVYGFNKSVSQIIEHIRQDKSLEGGRHPNLRT
jgi:hypothetical protein